MNLTQDVLSKDEINGRFLDAVQQLLRHRLVSSKATLAEAFDVKPAKFSEILNGRMKAGVDMLAKICDYYYVSPTWLLMSRGDNIFRNSEELPPVILYEGDGCELPPYLQGSNNETNTNKKDGSESKPNTAIEPFLQLIREKDETIKKQAEEIGQLRERLEQTTRRLEKIASDAHTSNIADVG